MTTSALESVDFVTSSGKLISGLVPVSSSKRSALNIDEQAAVVEAASFEHIDYVFFRRFSDGRSSQVAAYIVDNADERCSPDELANLHLKLWLHGSVPLLYISWPTRIDILTSARGPDFWNPRAERPEYKPAKVLKTATAIREQLQKISAFRLSDGTFWEEEENHRLANHSKAAQQSLIQAVIETDLDLDGRRNPIMRRLLFLMVLIKYLEDRHVFPEGGWFGRFHKGAKSFFGVLRRGDPDEVCRLLRFLEEKFNGDIFTPPAELKETIGRDTLARFAELVEARTLGRQRYLWDVFSFEHLPVETISYLYQRFVEGGHGTVYTPPLVASLLLDYAMPYSRITGKERVLDPACGSGIFLVGALRRLINVWRSRNEWKRPDVESLKRIVSRSIYGIELDRVAIDLSSFSLSLAICDALKPDVIWRDLKFEPLRGINLIEGDFFRTLLDHRESKSRLVADGFDVVIGNPPFESDVSEAGDKLNVASQKLDDARGTLPDRQAAYLFFEQSFSVLRSYGRVCLIQPSGFLYSLKTKQFRASITRKHRIGAVLDFTSIRNLYEADTKTIAVVAESNQPPPNNRVDHWTFRRTVSVHERICFELDHYDRHKVSQKDAEGDPHVWRINLFGGGRLLDISKRLRKQVTLEKRLDEKKLEGWDYSEGFIVGNRENRADFLTGKKTLPTSALTTAGIDESRLKALSETRFERPRREAIFTPPLILIKKLDSLPLAFWNECPLTYRSEIIGIHAPMKQREKLRELYDSLQQNRETLLFFLTIHGSRSFISKSTAVSKQDVMLLPVPESGGGQKFSFWEQAILEDILAHMASFVRLGQNSKLLKSNADEDHLHQYATIFLRMLGSVYRSLRQCKPRRLNGLICQPFYFGSPPDLSWLSDQVEELMGFVYDDEEHRRRRTIRVFRFYFDNVLFIVKPDRLRYWIRSTAIRDADETLIDLRRQGF